jgi:hypothetical protein
MALNFKRTVGGVGRKLELVNLANSQTVEVGDLIETQTTGQWVLGLAAASALGVVVALCDADGMPLPAPAVAAGTASGSDVRSQATVTTGIYYALVDVSKNTIYSASVSGTLGTTNDSNLRGCGIDVNSAGTEYGQLLENTATRTEGVETNFYSWGVDPNDSTRLLVSLAMSELDAQTT